MVVLQRLMSDGEWPSEQINIIPHFPCCRSLNLNNNLLKSIIPRESFNGFLTTLTKLDLSGEWNAATNLQDLKRSVFINFNASG